MSSPAPSPAPRHLSVKKKLLFSLFAVALCGGVVVGLLGLMELACRAMVYKRYGVPGKSYGIFMADKELGATHRPNSYNSNSRINNWGFRNVEDVPAVKPAGVLRVYCSGGSTTFCYNLDTEGAWPAVLGRKLRALPGHRNDEVWNAGQIGAGVAHEFILAKRQIPILKPDVVILHTGVNEGLEADLLVKADHLSLDQLFAEQKWGTTPKNLDQARHWKQHSALIKLWNVYLKPHLEKEAGADFRTNDTPADWQNWPANHPWVVANQEHTLRSYLAFLKGQGCMVILIRYGDNGSDDWYSREGIRVWRERAVAVAREADVAIYDMEAMVEKHPQRKALFIASGVHVTSEGAEALTDGLVNLLAKNPEHSR